MRKIVTAIVLILLVATIQFISYHILAHDKLSRQAIKNMEINSQLLSDTIIFSSAISVHGNQQEAIKPYNLNLLNKENFRGIKNKLSPSVVLEETAYATYCDKVSKAVVKHLDSVQLAMFVDNLYSNKSKVYITALEERTFFVTVNYNWSAHKEFFYEEGQYVWLFFSWLKI